MAEQKPEAAGVNIGIGGSQSAPELQGILVQLGRIADLLAQLVDYELTNPVKPQPFGGDVSGSGGIGA